MDPQQYVDARWHALVRAAVDLGVGGEDAPALVRRVLADQHRRIRRAEDPDPLVHAALVDAVHGPREHYRPPWRALAGTVAALGAVLAVVALTRPDAPPTDHLDADQVPSVFGYSDQGARDLLTGLGLEVTVEPIRACEVAGRALGSDPQRGTAFDPGDPITLYTAVPASITCLTDYQRRATAWQLVDLAGGRGSGPPFADRVLVYTGAGSPTVLTRDQAADLEAWARTGVLDALLQAVSGVLLTDVRPPTYAVPAIRIVPATDGLGACGVPEPSVAGSGDAFAVLVLSPSRSRCPLRLEVYREDGAVDAVALYAGSS